MDVDVLVKKAGDAFKANNFKTAYDLMSHCLASSPNDGNLFELFHAMAAKRRPGFVERLVVPIPALIAGQVLRMLGKPLSAMKACHRAVWSFPRGIAGLRQFAASAQDAGNFETAIAALQKAHALRPRRISLLRQFGKACWRGKKFKVAQKCFFDIQRRRPHDKETARALKDLAADATINEGRYDEKGDFRQSIKEEEVQRRLRDEKRAVITEEDSERALQDLEANVASSPDKIVNYLKLAELHRKAGRLGEAEEALRKGLEVSPQNGQLLAALSELAVVRRRDRLEEARRRLAANPDDEGLQRELAELKREALDFEIKEQETLLRGNPMSSDLRMKLGDLYVRADRTNDAIAEFQKCANDPRRRLRALLRLGQAFHVKGMHDMAARQFETVVDELEVMNDLKKEATYELAGALEDLGKADEALAHYQTVYEVDISYRDVAVKVETLYNKRRESKQ